MNTTRVITFEGRMRTVLDRLKNAQVGAFTFEEFRLIHSYLERDGVVVSVWSTDGEGHPLAPSVQLEDQVATRLEALAAKAGV